MTTIAFAIAVATLAIMGFGYDEASTGPDAEPPAVFVFPAD